MTLFPFPDRIQSREELKKDVLYNKIPEEDRVHICEMAWIRGVSTAQKILNKFPKQNIHQILTGERVKITTVSKDEVCGNIRIFGEFYSTKKEIVIYTESIANGRLQISWKIGLQKNLFWPMNFFIIWNVRKLVTLQKNIKCLLLELEK